ncbi:MAG TPA: iron-containing alcohol dehydrogenase [Syntrophales bacterium]|nr:iron-containing alcohol dehydrogenase [Syntrophales bacterium]HPX81936.1 iron-containing alcohol dehydrogenase [Syntrophales bacterium]HQB13723.1 iron-containing alcohol dehydrogenase [Syntrophales bacterium]HQK79635.1 iron-containing alcohol dehydrogenase [Syntrophales bacterium]
MYLPGYYEYSCRVKIVAGHDALEGIPALLRHVGARRPLLVTDKGVAGAGLVDIVRQAIGDRLEIGAVADDVPPDSDLKVVHRLSALYRENGCDAMIAVGGGSVMDTAKGINIVVSERAEDLMKFSGSGALKRPLKPLIAVPTTAGTGSEVTLVAVIKDHERHLKMAFVSFFLLPDAAILDSRMTLSLPAPITASTGMDALTHAVEAYYCLSKNPLSDVTALAAIRLISGNLLKVVRKPSDREGRLAMANAATLAGMAFSNSMVGMVHTLGHATGSVCGVPHGVCMAILLPYGLEYNRHKREVVMGELLFPIGGPGIYGQTAPEDRTNRVIAYVRQLNEDLHEMTGGRHARFLGEVIDREGNPAVPRERLPDIARTALGDGSIFYNPEDLDYDDLLMVLEAAWEGMPLDSGRIRKG